MLTAKMHVWPAPCAEGPPPPSSTALPPCHCLRASQAPAPHPLPPTARRRPPTVDQSAVSSLSSPSPAAPSAHHSGVASTAAQRTTPHSLAIDRTARSLARPLARSPAAACPDPAPFPSQLCSSRAAPVGPISLRLRQGSRCRRRVPRPAASISGAPKTPGSSPAPPRWWVLAELG